MFLVYWIYLLMPNFVSRLELIQLTLALGFLTLWYLRFSTSAYLLHLEKAASTPDFVLALELL